MQSRQFPECAVISYVLYLWTGRPRQSLATTVINLISVIVNVCPPEFVNPWIIRQSGCNISAKGQPCVGDQLVSDGCHPKSSMTDYSE